MADDARVVHRDAEVRPEELSFDGIERVQLRPQPLTARFVTARQEEPTPIAPREQLALGDDETEERHSIVLAHERDADPADLLELGVGLHDGEARDRRLTRGVEDRVPRRRVRDAGERDVGATAERSPRRLVRRHDDDVVRDVACVADARDECRIDEEHCRRGDGGVGSEQLLRRPMRRCTVVACVVRPTVHHARGSAPFAFGVIAHVSERGTKRAWRRLAKQNERRRHGCVDLGPLPGRARCSHLALICPMEGMRVMMTDDRRVRVGDVDRRQFIHTTVGGALLGVATRYGFVTPSIRRGGSEGRRDVARCRRTGAARRQQPIRDEHADLHRDTICPRSGPTPPRSRSPSPPCWRALTRVCRSNSCSIRRSGRSS